MKLTVPHIKCMLWLPAMEVQNPPGQRHEYPYMGPRTHRYWQWKYPQLRCHSCPRRTRGRRTPQWPCIKQSKQIISTHKGDKWLASMSRGWSRTTNRDLELHSAWTSKSLNSTPSATSTHTYWTLQRSNMAIHRTTQYTVPHRKLNLTHSLLQDIAVFNKHNSTKLEDWLTDIETAADLTTESRAKLTKVKSRGLMHTIVREAITSNQSWDEIKDLLWLKLCNANIQTYTSYFMEIQQWVKESLASYIHQFKTKANRCNFMNDAPTIRIFIKGLKNAHSLATHIYEKGPQTLRDALSEVEKFNAVQQLTATIIPPSTVNMMSNDESHCFQCQQQVHIARNCPNIRCFKCDEYGHIVMDCPQRIPPLGTPAKHHQHKPHRSHPTRSSWRHYHEDRYRQSCSRSQSHFYRHCSSSHYDSYKATPGHDTGIIATTPEVAQDNHAPHRDYSNLSHHDTSHWPHHRSSTHRSSSAYHSRDQSRSHSHPFYKIIQERSAQVTFTFQQITRQTTPQEEPKSENRRSPHRQLQFWWPFQQLRRGDRSFKLNRPSQSSDSHEQGGLTTQEPVTVALIMDCPTITVHIRKSYKALINSGAAISLIRYSTYQLTDDSF